jgi:hypothetical protein
MEQHALSDKMPIRHDFEAPFEVEIYEREGWNYVPTEQSILTYYTDASRKDWLTGLGIYGPSVRYYEALGALTTIFQAGMYAPESALIQKTWQPSYAESADIIHFHLKTSGGKPR